MAYQSEAELENLLIEQLKVKDTGKLPSKITKN